MAIAVSAGKAPPQQQGPAALCRGVAQCASGAGAASVKPRTEFENWRARRQRNGEGRRHLRSVAKRCKGLGCALPCVEEKPAGLRRRFVALPKGENDREDCEAEGPLRHVPRYVDAVFGEVETVFDLKASFFRVSLPQGNRASFRSRAETGRFAGHARLQMGYKRGPEMLHTVMRALAGERAVVLSRCAAPKSLKICVWIGNIRIRGWRQGVEVGARCDPECEAVRRPAW
ncbi:hypothetical protein ERJ75_001424800 [Trypanosoma vivax]|nr:hypothetical protein ERJ75_001424800 [Trypanosoma vivax]